MNAFADALDAIYSDPNIASDARYTAPGGVGFTPCRVITPREDREMNIGEGRPFTSGALLKVRAYEVTPQREGVFVLGVLAGVVFTPTETLTVQDDPRRVDPRKYEWTCTVA